LRWQLPRRHCRSAAQPAARLVQDGTGTGQRAFLVLAPRPGTSEPTAYLKLWSVCCPPMPSWRPWSASG